MTGRAELGQRPDTQKEREEKELGRGAKAAWDILHKALILTHSYDKALAELVGRRTSAGLNPLGEPIKFSNNHKDYSVDLSTPGVLAITSTSKDSDTQIAETARVGLGEVNNFRFKGTKPLLYYRQDVDGVTEQGIGRPLDNIWAMAKAINPHVVI